MKKYLIALFTFFIMLNISDFSYASRRRGSTDSSDSNNYYNNSLWLKKRSDGQSMKKIPDSVSKHFKDKSQTKDDYLQRAEVYLFNEDYHSAISDFEQVLKEDKYDLQSIVGLAESHFKLGNTFAVNEYIERAFDRMMSVYFSGPFYNSLWARAYTIRAELREQSGDTEGATADREKANSLK